MVDTPAFTVVPDAPLASGTVIAGRYRIERPIGSGGFARVYLASHLEVESLKVAIKIIHPHRASPEALTRFRNEATLLARLRNRHTVRLTDFGVTDDGIAFLVMEYVEGTPLDRVIHARGYLGEADTARVGIGVLKALVEAHTTGVIHRDLKPANIMMVSELGERHTVPRVLDFGIARVLGGGSPVEEHIVRPDGSREPVVYCTPAYAAPELLKGRPDYATDLYSLGLVLCEMLDGRSPYEFPDPEPERSPHLWPEPVPLGDRAAASRLAPVLSRAMAKSLDDRYETAKDMLADMERVYDGIRIAEEESSSLDVLAIASIPPTVERPPTRPARFVATTEIGDSSETAAAVRERLERDRARREAALSDAPTAVASGADVDDDSTTYRVAPSSPAKAPGGPVDTFGGAGNAARAGTPAPPVPAPLAAQTTAPRGHDSRLSEVLLFGRRVASTKARGMAVVIAILAIVLPALIAAWSVLSYVRDSGPEPQVIPAEELE